MLNGSHYPGAAGSELARLLAGLGAQAPLKVPGAHAPTADLPSAAPRPAFAQRLSEWLRWTGAIALSAALDSAPRGPAASPSASAAPEAQAFDAVYRALAGSIRSGCREPASGPADFAPFKRHCLAQQRAMQDAVGSLRHELRAALTRHSPTLARLAAIDAVMDHALAVEERRLLALVPLRLQAHFEALRRAQGDAVAPPPSFQDDMARVLHAELMHRLLPARGLLAALLAPPAH